MAIVYGVLAVPWYYLHGSPEEKCRQLYGDNPFAESPVIGRFIAQNTRPEGSVFILGSEPQILYYAGRKSASRFIFVYPLMIPTPAARDLLPTSLLAQPATPSDLFDESHAWLKQSYQVVGLLPFRDKAPMLLVTGEEATQVWQRYPVWYDSKRAPVLAIWRRVEPSP
jgi:hypothetical protein